MQLNADKFAVTKAEFALDIAKNKIDVLRRLTRAKMVEQFKGEIEKARAKLVADEIGLRIEDINYKEIEDQIKKCTMVSPGDGQLVYANVNAGRGGGGDFVVEEGASVRYGQSIARLPDNSNMQVKAKVAEAFVTALKPGMKAKIKLDAFDGEPLSGEVIRVSDFAEPGQWMGGGTKEYATIIRIENPPPRLRSGLTSEVEIVVEDLPSEIQIPVQSVYEHKRTAFCLVKKGDKFETRQLKLGPNNAKSVVVKDGIAADELVLLDPSNNMNLFQFPDIKTPEPEPMAPNTVVAAKSGESPTAGAPTTNQEIANTAAPPGAPVAAGGGKGAGPGGPGGPGGRGGGRGPRQTPEERFKVLDTNGDGNVTQAEVDASAMDDRIKGFIMMGDTNGDGNLTLDESKAASERMRAMGGPGGGGQGGGGGPPGGGP